MNTIFFIVIIALLAGVLFFLLKKQHAAPAPADQSGLNLLLQQINELSRTVDEKLSHSQKEVAENMRFQSTQSQTLIRDITEKLTRLDETNKQVISFTDQLQSLQDILKNPKQRGTILGEYYLETILSKVLPPKTFQVQYKFKNGDTVDAVVFVGDKIIPIDSKFSLENYNRIIEANSTGNNPEPFVQEFKKDIKKRIDETSKYIKTEENTLEFAFMFIPHESIYYDLLVAEVGAVKINTQDLIEYAFSKKVIIVSPTSFLAYLQTVLQGMRALKIEASAKDIIERVKQLGNHLQKYDTHHQSLGKALATATNQFELSQKEFNKIDKDVIKITSNTINPDTLIIEGSPEE
ncbi:MAG: DNA recombination protein RmuC [bacterium]